MPRVFLSDFKDWLQSQRLSATTTPCFPGFCLFVLKWDGMSWRKKLSYLLYIQFCTKWNSCLVKISDSTVVAMRYSLHFECNNSIQFWSFYSTSSITAVSGGVIFSFSLNVGRHCHSVICNTGNNQGFVCA